MPYSYVPIDILSKVLVIFFKNVRFEKKIVYFFFALQKCFLFNLNFSIYLICFLIIIKPRENSK